METKSAPSLLPILRSRQQGEVLTYLMCDPDRETSMSELAHRVGVPLSSVHREVERAEAAGIVTSRRLGNTRFVRADTDSPYFDSLSDLLVKAFGPPHVLAEALDGVVGIEAAYVFGSWAARLHGVSGRRPVNDIDVLVLGEPDRGELYRALSGVEERLGRPVNVVIRDSEWLQDGSGGFHATVTERPVVAIEIKKSRGTDRVRQSS
ncbi:winged helix-turn-helix transcriptional regulator [Candidatus Poriferisodalis sp.]|uniref:winged helix-turn-helix transcriptional regulator n=1 Tax=Candidatus Poriferisodalis sp. TaxID=3101277 RepID=UPI003B5CE40B